MRTIRSIFPRSLAAATLVALGLLPLLTACGGKGDKPANAASPTTNPLATVPEGFWHGTVNERGGRSFKANCLVLASGETRVVVKDHFLLAFNLSNGKGDGHYNTLGFGTFGLGGGDKKPMNFTVTRAEHQKSFSAQYVVNGQNGRPDGEKGDFAFDRYDAGYDKSIDPAAMAGNYSGVLEIHKIERLEAPKGISMGSYKKLPIVIGADGTLNGGRAESFHLHGTYSIPNKDKAGIKLTLTYTPADGKGFVETFHGMGVVSSEEGKRVVTLTAHSEHGGFIVGCLTSADATS